MSSPSTGSIQLPTSVTQPITAGIHNLSSVATAAMTRPLSLPHIHTNQRVLALSVSGFLIFSTLGGSILRNALGWWGWGIWVATALVVSAIWCVEAIKTSNHLSLKSLVRDIPIPLVIFLAIAGVSIAWSDYRVESAAGFGILLGTVFAGLSVAYLLSWREITQVLDYVTRGILAGSLLFEFLAATLIQHPIAPAWASSGILETLQPQNLWTEANLFEGGRIHGLVGNAADLSLIAGISLIVLSVRITDHKVRYISGLPWMALAATTLMLARSTTIILALTVTAAVAAAVFIRRWMLDRDEVRLFWLGITAMASTAFGILLVLGVQLLGLFGKNPDLTGRMDLWQSIMGLVREAPLLGHGWVGYWSPSIEQFAALTADWPMQQVHAHNAWLDVWLQLGIFGVLVFAAIWFISIRFSWLRATDVPVQVKPQAHGERTRLSVSGSRDGHVRTNSLSLLPLLLLSLLFVQSMAESMILIEGTLVLFVIVIAKTCQLGRGRTLIQENSQPATKKSTLNQEATPQDPDLRT